MDGTIFDKRSEVGSFFMVVAAGDLIFNPGVTKRCRLSWLTNSALVYETKNLGEGGVAVSQPMSTAVHRSHFGDLTPYLTLF